MGLHMLLQHLQVQVLNREVQMYSPQLSKLRRTTFCVTSLSDSVPISGNKELNAEDHLLVVLQKLSTVCQSWYYIGLMLRIRIDKLDCIKLEHHETQSCMRAMVSTWLQGLDPQPTWDALTQALHSCVVGEDQVAQKLALELKTQQISKKLTTTLPSGNILGYRCSFDLLLEQNALCITRLIEQQHLL